MSVQQQSWAAWLLDSYASSVSPNPSEPSADDNEYTGSSNRDSASPTNPQSRNSMASSSPYGPYVKTGRGGAGNFTWQSQQQQQSQTTNDDLEAQKPSALSERRKAAAKIEHLDTGAAVQASTSRRPVSQYIRVGRGFVQSNEIQHSPRSPTGTISSPTTPLIVSPTNTMRPGRGGAGNFAAALEAKERTDLEKEMQARLEADKRRQQIAEEVESKLLPPPDAWLGGRRRSMNLPEAAVV